MEFFQYRRIARDQYADVHTKPAQCRRQRTTYIRETAGLDQRMDFRSDEKYMHAGYLDVLEDSCYLVRPAQRFLFQSSKDLFRYS